MAHLEENLPFRSQPWCKPDLKMCQMVRVVTSVITLLVMGRMSKAINSAKNIDAIRNQIVKDMGMDHIPDVKHVSIFNS